MKVSKTAIDGVFIIEPQVFEDARGYFFESWNKAKLKEQGIDYDFIQDNQSKSCFGTIRGIHFQKGEFAQAKLVRVLEGTVLDVAVDLRPGSSTFGRHVAVELSAENKKTTDDSARVRSRLFGAHPLCRVCLQMRQRILQRGRRRAALQRPGSGH